MKEDLSFHKLKRILEDFKNKKIIVVGDFIADLYVYSLASRVSREAPVLILKYEGERVVLGGGANALNNVRSLGAKAIPVGFVGDDQEGRQLVSVMRDLGIDTNYVFPIPGRTTVTKMRILAGSHHTVKQQVLRLDKEPGDGVEDHYKRLLFDALECLTDVADAVLISDYGYGTIDGEVLDFLKEKFDARIITADSRYNLLDFKDITAVTPNEPEAAAALGLKKVDDSNIVEAGKRLLELTGNEAVLITRGRKGMALFEREGSVHFIDIYGTDEVADVTGAGDTVIATFTLALACGATFYEAAKLANYAGGIVVMKSGTATVSQGELLKAVEDELANG